MMLSLFFVGFHSQVVLVFLQTAWILIKRSAEYKPLQFLAFAFVYRIFEKLKAFEPPVSQTYTVSEIYNSSILPSCGTLDVEALSIILTCLNKFFQHLRCFWLQEEGEDEGRTLRLGKRILRSLALVFGSVAFASLVLYSSLLFGVVLERLSISSHVCGFNVQMFPELSSWRTNWDAMQHTFK
jgi:hypothetical protein